MELQIPDSCSSWKQPVINILHKLHIHPIPRTYLLSVNVSEGVHSAGNAERINTLTWMTVQLEPASDLLNSSWAIQRCLWYVNRWCTHLRIFGNCNLRLKKILFSHSRSFIRKQYISWTWWNFTLLHSMDKTAVPLILLWMQATYTHTFEVFQ